MTDAHCHVSCGDGSVRELVIGRDFFGVHPWECLSKEEGRRKKEDGFRFLEGLREMLLENPKAGVGEIGLDRLREKAISQKMRDVFEAQLSLAIELRRPVVLHGAKCWGQVVETIKRMKPWGQTPIEWGQTPGFLFHGFSRSDGLMPDIISLNGYISVGPAILNDHAVNYRELVKKIPRDRLLVETDRTEENAASCPHLRDVLGALAEVLGERPSVLEELTDENAARFMPEVR